MIFLETTLTYTNSVHANSTCSDEIFRVIESRSYSLSKSIEPGSSIKEIDYTTLKVSRITYKQEGIYGVDYLNGFSAYGISDWKVNEEREVSGKSPGDPNEPEATSGHPSNGDMLYQIFKIDGEKLFFGDNRTGDSLSQSTRPNAILDSIFFSKRN